MRKMCISFSIALFIYGVRVSSYGTTSLIYVHLSPISCSYKKEINK